MPKSTYQATNVLEATLRQVPFVAPSAIFVALYTGAPGISGGGTEVSGVNYARQQVVFVPSSGGQTTNEFDVLFPIASTDWGVVVAYGLLDAITSGNLLYFSNLSNPRTILTNDQLKFTAGQIAVVES